MSYKPPRTADERISALETEIEELKRKNRDLERLFEDIYESIKSGLFLG